MLPPCLACSQVSEFAFPPRKGEACASRGFLSIWPLFWGLLLSSFMPGYVMGRPRRGAALATGSSGDVQRGQVKPKL